MKILRNTISSVTLLAAINLTAAHAFVVDFENFASLDIPNNFIAQSDYDLVSPTFQLNNPPITSFGSTGGITFTGGVLLEDPLNSDAGTIIGDMGSVYYGTAFSPSTSIITTNYQNLLAVDITTQENITSVQGGFIHGLNTRLDELLPDVDSIEIGYTISYFLEGITSPVIEELTAIFSDGDEIVNFGLDTNLLADTMMGALITRVEIVADEYDFINSAANIGEYDFLLGSVRFNEGASPVPVPAALPLFISALLGGMVFARPKKNILKPSK